MGSAEIPLHAVLGVFDVEGSSVILLRMRSEVAHDDFAPLRLPLKLIKMGYAEDLNFIQCRNKGAETTLINHRYFDAVRY